MQFRYTTQRGAATAGIVEKFLLARANGFSGDKLSGRCMSAGANGSLRRADAALTPFRKALLDHPVLQRVEGDDCQPSADIKQVKRGVKRS